MKNVPTPNPKFLGNLQSLAYRHFYGFKSYKVFSYVFQPRDTLLSKDLAKDKDLVICKPDKGKCLVLVDCSCYNSSLNAPLTNPYKFVEIADQISRTILKIEDKINLLCKLEDSSALSPETYIKFIPLILALVFYTAYLKFASLIFP
jgi:hypothetical protein